MKLPIKSLLLVALILSARAVGACDCQVLSMQRAYQLADYVVLAEVLHSPYYGGTAPVVIGVDKVVKGHLRAKQLTLANTGLDCKFYFRPLTKYVVFLNDSRGGGYVASPCQKHFLLTDTASLEALRSVSE